ncbi:MAG: DUF1697 domain-containing protein [Rhodoferax sp.]
MNTCVALLRSINVGGKGDLPMKELVATLEAMGARKVRTYIQSGNAVFESAEKNAVRLGRSKLAASAERLLGVPMTDRNWRTVCKIMELAEL